MISSMLIKSKHKFWRIRVGDYRVIYHIKKSELIVLIVKIGDRREVYQKLDRIKF